MMNLGSIQVLYRQPDTMSLWGLPHGLRPGQSPRDLMEADNSSSWFWLGTPGWWGSLSAENVEAIQAFLEPLRELDAVPTHPGEFSVLGDFLGG